LGLRFFGLSLGFGFRLGFRFRPQPGLFTGLGLGLGLRFFGLSLGFGYLPFGGMPMLFCQSLLLGLSFLPYFFFGLYLKACVSVSFSFC
jgi:hypothetical protein